jgi:2,5-diamino-6-(ribosylamino)-4(3H)-pyrimidinone 5'-phosphate reductase
MLPKVIMNDQVSIDGSILGFDYDLELFYTLTGVFNADAMLVGSTTARKGIDLFMKKVPKETEKDYEKPVINKSDKRPFWALIDTRGKMKNLLHVIRQSGYAKFIIVFVSKKTPKAYLNYLEKRNYQYYIMGKDKVDLKKALELLRKKYKARTIVTESGGTLNCALLERKLIDKISILLTPVLVNKYQPKLFRTLCRKKNIKLKLLKCQKIKDHVHLIYKVLK